MGIRETLNQKPGLAVGGAITIIVLIVVFLVWPSGGGPGGPGAGKQQSFFTVDDGKNYFADDARNIPPYDYKGKPAVQAYVFACNGQKSVAYLKRYTAEGKRKRESAQHGDPAAAGMIDLTGAEVKKPGDKDWVLYGSPKGQALAQPPACNGTLELVSP